VRSAFAGGGFGSALYAITFAVWLAIELRQALHRRAEATNTDRGSLNVVRLLAAAGAVIAALAAGIRVADFPVHTTLVAVSLVFMWAGVGLRWWCFRTLGHYFTFQVMTSADQQVITGGPYRVLRHPSYAGIMLILFGIGLTYGNWISLAALVILPLIGFMNRIRVEEAALEAALGGRYTTYAAGRKRLVPFVW
jgi:protein-S-isoprenylcysteine O-methyltransferase Ste14